MDQNSETMQQLDTGIHKSSLKALTILQMGWNKKIPKMGETKTELESSESKY